MNPALIHNTYPLNYSLSTDFKFQPSDRHYSSNSLSNEYIDRRNGLANSSLSQPLPLGASNNGIDYSSNQIQHETACNTNSHLILTPPQSGDESSSTITNPSSASFTYSTLPKVSLGNVSGPDYYSSATPGFLQAGFNGAGMTPFDRRGALQIPTPLSPPYNYGPLNSNSFPPPYSMTRPMDYGNYSRSGTYTHDIFRHRPPFGGSLSSSVPYNSSMPQAPPSRVEGPPFEETQKINSLVNSRGQPLSVDIIATIPKGFFRVDDKWTCYRRNYFSVSCGFTFKPHNLDSQPFLSRYNHAEPVTSFAVSITAKTAAANTSESEVRGLVQHTPKRDKATESVPVRHVVVPTSAQTLNGGLNVPQNAMYSTNSHLATCLQSGLDAFGQSTAQSPQNSYTFERIQFQKATANNGKRRAQQQYFHVVVKLEVNVGHQGGPDDWVIIATKQSHPMVVRGRSPGHYKDGRRDSQTSMDPDGGSGHAGDSNHSGFPMHHLSHGHTTSMNSTPSNYRSSHHYGTSFSHTTHRVNESDNSSTSPGSSATLGSSPRKGENYRLPCNVTHATLPDASFDRIVLSPITNRSEADLMDYHHAKKQLYEEDTADCTGSFFHPPLNSNYHNLSFDFSATSATQALCASS